MAGSLRGGALSRPAGPGAVERVNSWLHPQGPGVGGPVGCTVPHVMRSQSESSKERGTPKRARAPRTGIQAVILVIIAALVIIAVWVGVGFLLSKVLNDDAVGQADRSLSRVLVRNRTSELNQTTHWVTYLSETETVIAAGLLIALAARLAWKRWRDQCSSRRRSVER